jgi:hypothetical protein
MFAGGNFLLGIAVAPVVLSACATSQMGSARESTCPRLDSQLFQLSTSADPATFASGAGLELGPSGVRAVIELASGGDFPSGYRVRVAARYANLVEGEVPISELCALAREPAVLSVARPARPVPGSARP